MHLLRSGRQVALGGILLASFGRGGTAVPSTTAPRNLYPPADERLPNSGANVATGRRSPATHYIDSAYGMLTVTG